MPSSASITATVRPKIRMTAPGLARPSELLTARRSSSEMRRPNRRRVSTTMTTNPRPPNCINNKMTHWPKRVNAVLVVTTDRPVTAAADVDVKRASIKPMCCVVMPGSSSSPVPTPISVASATRRRSGIGT